MSEKRYKRFYVSESENQLTIYDNDGLDDYYHLGNDERDVKGICKLLNNLHQENQILETDCKNQKESKEYWRNKAKELKEENEQLKEELNNLKKDETMLYHYYTLARYGGDGV